MTENYIATFFSHFGAMAFKKCCDREGFPARIMPVPRSLSSSCGTCVGFTGDGSRALSWRTDELEQLVRAEADGKYTVVWKEE